MAFANLIISSKGICGDCKLGRSWRGRYPIENMRMISINSRMNIAMSFCPSLRLFVRFYANQVQWSSFYCRWHVREKGPDRVTI